MSNLLDINNFVSYVEILHNINSEISFLQSNIDILVEKNHSIISTHLTNIIEMIYQILPVKFDLTNKLMMFKEDENIFLLDNHYDFLKNSLKSILKPEYYDYFLISIFVRNLSYHDKHSLRQNSLTNISGSIRNFSYLINEKITNKNKFRLQSLDYFIENDLIKFTEKSQFNNTIHISLHSDANKIYILVSNLNNIFVSFINHLKECLITNKYKAKHDLTSILKFLDILSNKLNTQSLERENYASS